MKAKVVSSILATLLLAACAREQTNSDGNGTGKADGVGGRQDPPTAPAQGQPSDQTDGASSTPPSSPQPQQ
jgi:hypothetical protein